MIRRRLSLTTLVVQCACVLAFAQQPNTNLGKDANGNPLRLAVKTGHVSNYDEAKLRPYTLPDPLVLANGQRVRDAQTWMKRRRPEIVRLYETQIFGRIPAKTPKVAWETAPIRGFVPETTTDTTLLVGKVGAGSDAPKMNVTLDTPAQARGPVPVILLLNFGGGGAAVAEPPVAADILARGWGYATVGYQDIQPDKIDTFDRGVIGATGRPAADEWGTIDAWAWGVSRIIDALQANPRVDPTRIALHGHSRLGKTALWASALDDRIAAVYASCPGEMGAALSRRDFGETVDDMAQNFPYWFAGSFQKWAGRWNDMPVDAHLLIALSAPRPVFITGGTQDQWADPVGEFLAEVAAGPVYRLLGKKDAGVDRLPPPDTPLIDGDLGWYYHTGPHAATPADWQAFLHFLDKYFAR
jgi:dienelactone hydrolase